MVSVSVFSRTSSANWPRGMAVRQAAEHGVDADGVGHPRTSHDHAEKRGEADHGHVAASLTVGLEAPQQGRPRVRTTIA